MGANPTARAGRHGHLVVELTAEGLAPGSGWTAPGEHVHDLAHPARGWAELAEEPHVVRNRRRTAPPQARCGARPRPRWADSDACRPPVPRRCRPPFRFDAGHRSEMKPATL